MFTQRTHINSKKCETIILAYSKQNCPSIDQFTKYILRYTLPSLPPLPPLPSPSPSLSPPPTTYSSCTVSTLVYYWYVSVLYFKYNNLSRSYRILLVISQKRRSPLKNAGSILPLKNE